MRQLQIGLVLFLFSGCTSGFIVPEPQPVLRSVAVVQLPATPVFDVEKNLVENRELNAEVLIFSIDSSFKENFYGLIEDPQPASSLYSFRIQRESAYEGFQRELGGGERMRTTIGKIYELMKLQGRGKRGHLLMNGDNLFEVKDKNGVDRAVNVWSNDYGWNLVAWPIDGDWRYPLVFQPADRWPLTLFAVDCGWSPEEDRRVFSASR